MAGKATIIALSSGRLPAALAVVRASGPDALVLAAALAGPLPPPRHASLRRLVDPRTGETIDRGLVLAFPGPDSATGENLIEFHLHGGRAVVDALLDAATATPGVRLAEAGEFTRRALTNGRIDLVEADGLADLLAAETEWQRRAAQARAGGAVSEILEGWRRRLLDLSAMAEVAIDYADEEDGASPTDLVGPIEALAAEVRVAISAPRIESLRDGVRVVIAGPTNAGKSSLINALSNSDRAIVTPIAGTTRDSIEVAMAIDGLPVILVDTAGLRETDDPVEQIGVARARTEIDRADLILWLDREGADDFGEDHRIVNIHAKSDLGPAPPGMLGVSSLSGDGVVELLALVHRRAEAIVPSPRDLALTRREAELLGEIVTALGNAAVNDDPILAAEELRGARLALDRITGRAGVEDLLDALFSRFCVGK